MELPPSFFTRYFCSWRFWNTDYKPFLVEIFRNYDISKFQYRRHYSRYTTWRSHGRILNQAFRRGVNPTMRPLCGIPWIQRHSSVSALRERVTFTARDTIVSLRGPVNFLSSRLLRLNNGYADQILCIYIQLIACTRIV